MAWCRTFGAMMYNALSEDKTWEDEWEVHPRPIKASQGNGLQKEIINTVHNVSLAVCVSMCVCKPPPHPQVCLCIGLTSHYCN